MMIKIKDIATKIIPKNVFIYLIKDKIINDRLELAKNYENNKNTYNKIFDNTYNKVFDNIYKNNLWSSDESYSGRGSELKSTKILRTALPRIWKEYKIKTFLDVPCGDFHWMKEVDKSNISYIGGDIVFDLIEINNKLYNGGGKLILN